MPRTTRCRGRSSTSAWFAEAGRPTPEWPSPNAQGEARERWTLGTVADTQKLEARAVDPQTGDPLLFATFVADARADVPVELRHASPDSTSAASGQALTVVAVAFDQYGNVVPDASVEWEVTEGGGSVSPATSGTDVQGRAETRWTLGSSPGRNELRATAGTAEPLMFTATGEFSGTWQLTIVSGQGQYGYAARPLPQALVVELRDSQGRPVPVQR